MKILILLVCAGFVFCAEDLQVITNTINEDDTDFFKEMQELFGEKCQENLGPEGPKKLQNTLEELQTCLAALAPKNPEELKQKLQDSSSSSSSSEELCSDHTIESRKCFNKTIPLLEECADKEEKYISGFIFNALDNVYDFVCTNDMENIHKIFSLENMECFSTLVEKINDIDECIERIEAFKDDRPKGQVLTKAEVCRSLTELKTCSTNYIEKTCTHQNQTISTFVSGLFDAISSPCVQGSKNPADFKV